MKAPISLVHSEKLKVNIFHSLIDLFTYIEDELGYEHVDKDDHRVDVKSMGIDNLEFLDHDGSEITTGIYAQMATVDDDTELEISSEGYLDAHLEEDGDEGEEKLELLLFFKDRRISRKSLFKLIGHEIGHHWKIDHVDAAVPTLDYSEEIGNCIHEKKAKCFENFAVECYEVSKIVESAASDELGIEFFG